MHNTGDPLDDEGLAGLVAKVRASVIKMTAQAFDELADALGAPISSLALRRWPLDFPNDIATQRRPPFESRADSVMYCHVFAEIAAERGWDIGTYDAKHVEAEAAAILGQRADAVLHGPRKTLGPPWSKDHRTALAATIVSF